MLAHNYMLYMPILYLNSEIKVKYSWTENLINLEGRRDIKDVRPAITMQKRMLYQGYVFVFPTFSLTRNMLHILGLKNNRV